MGLLDLPNELLLQILDTSRPNEFEHFVLSCKHLHHLARDLIVEHNRLKKDFGSLRLICYSGSSSHSRESRRFAGHAMMLLAKLSDMPLAVQYIRRLDFGRCDELPEGRTIEEFMTDLERCETGCFAMSESLRRVGVEADDWCDAVSDKSVVSSSTHNTDGLTSREKARYFETLGDRAFIVLLLHAVNLRQLHIHHRTRMTFFNDRSYVSAIEKLARSDVGERSDQNPRMIQPASRPLGRLEVLGPWRSDTEFGTPVQAIAPFLLIPSLKKIVGFQYCAAGDRQAGLRDQWYWTYDWPYRCECAIEEIELSQSAISPVNLREFLKPMQSLRSFRHLHNSFGNGAGVDWDPASFLAVIGECCGRTLQDLTLATRSRCDFVPMDWSFMAFEQLRTLEIDAALLLDVRCRSTPKDGARSGARSLVEHLPSSLVELTLFTGSHLHSLTASLRTMDTLTLKKTPLLRMLEIIYGGAEPISTSDQVEMLQLLPTLQVAFVHAKDGACPRFSRRLHQY